MTAVKSSRYFFLLNKQRFVFFPLILLLCASPLRPPEYFLAYGFIEGAIGANRVCRIQHSVFVHWNVFQNDNQENNEGEENCNDIGINNDDIVQGPPIVPQQDVSLPCQLSHEILSSVEEKERRERERSLLAQVQEGDKAIKELRKLWGSQSGNTQKEELMYQAARGIGNPQLWDESRGILEKLTTENPTFLEPFARLSKLYCLMGRLEDSQTMALEVLKLKPWHILAIETMVATSYALNQIESSVYWASQRMPPPSQTAKRKEWIHRAIESSLEFENKLLELQQDQVQNKIKEDDIGKDERSFQVEKDAWQ